VRRLVFILVATAIAAATGAASARGDVRLTAVDATRHPTLQFNVVTSTPSTSPPRVRENGRRVFGLETFNLGRGKSVALLIDRSRSMSGGALGHAAAAARAFLAQKPPRDRVMVTTFGSQATQVTRFSSSTIDADGELRHLSVDSRSGTALYDAVRMASVALSAEPYPGRVLVVLTDGANTSKQTSLEEAAQAARRAGAVVYAIGIEGRDFSPGALRRLVSQTGGSYFPASSAAAVGDAYRAVAARLARTWRVSYLTASRPGREVQVATWIPGHGSDTKRLTLPGELATGSGSGRALLPSFLYAGGVGAYVLGLLVGGAALLATALVLATPASTRLRRRIAPHLGDARPEKRKVVRERFGAGSGLFKATEQAFAHFKFWHRLHAMLERADVPLRTVEFFYCMVAPALLLGFFAAVLALPTLVILGFMVFGALLPLGVLSFKAKRRVNKIDDQLPDLLATMAASLKAGHSFRQAMQAVVNEGQPPISDEFKRVLTEAQLGRPMDDALNEMSERVQSKNLSFVLTAVTIQRQVGGSLAGIFDMVADAVRQRQVFARKIRSLTAMGRASAYVLVAMPIVLALIITAMRYEYVEPLYTEPLGQKLIMVGAVMIVIGSWFLRKIASFKG
jgi:tight adherence protein B